MTPGVEDAPGETRPANVKGHWLLRRCTSTGRGVYSQIFSVWSAQNHSGYMGGESTNDQDECSQMYFHLIYQGLNFSLGSSITIWYLIRDVWLQSSDHFKLRLLFKPIFNHTFNPIFKSVSVLIMSMYVLLYYVPVYIPNITKIKPKAKNTCQMAGRKNLKMRRTLRAEKEEGRRARRLWILTARQSAAWQQWRVNHVQCWRSWDRELDVG